MKIPYVSIQNAINDWIMDGDIEQEEIKEASLLKWATDCIRWVTFTQQLVKKVTILQVKNYKARLPEDYKLTHSAAANPDYTPECTNCPEYTKEDYYKGFRRTRREEIVQWVQGVDEGCELEINLKCPRCTKTKCECDEPYIEVDVDRIWEMAHPEIYYSGMHVNKRIGRVGYGPLYHGDYHSGEYHPRFHLMRYASNDFFGIKPGCPNVDCRDCFHSFYLDLPFIEVDFEKGEILLSYSGYKKDENGDLMIPDHPDVHEAIYNHLEYKYWRMMFRKHSRQADLTKAQLAKAERDNHIGSANSALSNPENIEWEVFLENNFYQRLPDKFPRKRGNKMTRDRHSLYGDYLKGKRRRGKEYFKRRNKYK